MSDVSESLVHMLAAWNERDPKKIRAHLEKGVAKDVEFVDPNYAIEGIPAFVKMVKEFRTRFPDAVCSRTSGVDMHHDRARYSWRVSIDAKNGIDGFDAVAFSKKSGKVKRVDGFFGPLPPA